MSLYVWPPISLSITNVQVENPDLTQAQFNFTQVQDGVIYEMLALTTTPATVVALTATVKKILVKNDSGNNVFLRFGSRSKILVPKGADYDEFNAYGLNGENLTIAMESGVGTAGKIVINLLG